MADFGYLAWFSWGRFGTIFGVIHRWVVLKKRFLSGPSSLLYLGGIQSNVTWEMSSLASTWQLCPKTSKAIFVGDYGLWAGEGKKSPCLKLLRLIYFKVIEIMISTEEELAFSFTPFYLTVHKQSAQTSSQFVLLKETELSEKPVRPLLGMSRAIPETSWFTQCPARAATSRVTEVHTHPVSAWSLIPESVRQQSVTHRHLVRRIRVWHLAASALPPKTSKMSIVPWGFSPSLWLITMCLRRSTD